MATVHDVAAYIMKRSGPMTAMKLQKLAYYAQAWSLVWDDAPLFRARIEAWANGPVVPALYDCHRGQFKLTSWNGEPGKVAGSKKETIDAVLDYYGGKSSFWLSQLTHREDPWRNARRGMAAGERGNNEITHAAMAEYYGGLE